MTNKQIKNSFVDLFNVLKFSRFIAQPYILSLSFNIITLISHKLVMRGYHNADVLLHDMLQRLLLLFVEQTNL